MASNPVKSLRYVPIALVCPDPFAARRRDPDKAQAGRPGPNTSAEYTRALECLYPVAYSLKFASKDELDADFTVGPLEGLWRAEDPDAFIRGDKSAWDWTMLIAQPEVLRQPVRPETG